MEEFDKDEILDRLCNLKRLRQDEDKKLGELLNTKANFTSLAVIYAGFGSASQDASSPLLLFLGGIGLPAFGILVTYAALRLTYRNKH